MLIVNLWLSFLVIELHIKNQEKLHIRSKKEDRDFLVMIGTNNHYQGLHILDSFLIIGDCVLFLLLNLEIIHFPIPLNPEIFQPTRDNLLIRWHRR